MQALKTNGQMYDSVDLGNVVRSGFDMSFFNKGSGRLGAIIPTRCLEILPGDKLQGVSSAAIQFDPLAVPILSNMQVRQENFYAPWNTVWEHFDDFIRGGEDGTVKIPMPSKTLKQIYDCIVRNIFGQTFGDFVHVLSESGVENPATMSVQYRDMFSSINHDYNHLIDNLREFGVAYKVSDIIEHVFIPPIKDMIQYFANISEVDSSVYDKDADTLICFHKRPLTELAKFPELAEIMDSMNFYIRYKGLDYLRGTSLSSEYYEEYINRANDLVLRVPTEEFYILLQKQYEILRPFIGTSSVLDYMNVTRFVFRDYLFNALCEVYSAQIVAILRVMVAADQDNPLHVDEVVRVGINSDLFSDNPINILPLRALYSIWYNYYRDQLLETNIIEPQKVSAVSDDELMMLLIPRQRCWAKDTFTTALDNFGTANGVVPTTSLANVTYTKFHNSSVDATAKMEDEITTNNLGLSEIKFDDGSTFQIPNKFITTNHSSREYTGNFAVISLANLEQAQRAQKFWQRILLFGNRPQDFYYLNWRVKYLDSRLRIPEYLSSSSDLVAINTVTNNTTVGDTVAGDRAAVASAYDKGNNIDRFAEEYGVLISILSIMPETSYAYGQSRLYSKLDKFDYALPLFATMGLDAVYDSEIVSCPNAIPDFEHSTIYGWNGVGLSRPFIFGAQGRYYDNKSKQDEEHGLLQSTLSMYTFARQFNPYAKGGRPVLNYEFVHCFPRLDMFVVEDPSQDIFRYDIKHSLALERNLPVCSMYV